MVSVSTERRHRAGKATARVKASHAARRTIYAPRRPSQTLNVSSACLLSAHSAPTPATASQQSGNAPMPTLDNIANMSPGARGMDHTSDGTEAIDDHHSDETDVSKAVANVLAEAWQHPITNYASDENGQDDDDDQDQNCDDDDGFDWDAEMCDDDKMDVDRELGIEDSINESFERELAEFGKASPLSCCSQLIVFSQPKKSLKTKWLSFATLRSRSRAT